MYTHSAIARTFSLRGVQKAHSRIGSSVCKKVFCSACVFSPSRPVHSHVSPTVLGVPWRSLLLVHCFLELCPHQNRGACAVPHERRAARSLCIWQIPRTPQVLSPNSPTRRFLWTVTRRPSIAFLTSRKPHAKTLLFRVPTVCAPTSVSHASCGNVALPKESQPRETVR